MKNRDVIVGVVLVALIATGVYLVRSRSAPTEVPAGQAAAVTGERAAVDEVLPDATTGAAAASLGDLSLWLFLAPTPPVALATLHARVAVTRMGQIPPTAVGSVFPTVVDLQDGRISFEMVMPMGDHRYTLVRGADGWYEAAVVLPT